MWTNKNSDYYSTQPLFKMTLKQCYFQNWCFQYLYTFVEAMIEMIANLCYKWSTNKQN